MLDEKRITLKMDLEVYEPKEETKVKGPIRLRLVEHVDCISLTVVDAAGDTIEDGQIIDIFEDGTLARYDEVDPDLGFQLTEDGRVILDEED